MIIQMAVVVRYLEVVMGGEQQGANCLHGIISAGSWPAQLEPLKTTKYITEKNVGCEEAPKQLQKEKLAYNIYKISFTESKRVDKQKLGEL